MKRLLNTLYVTTEGAYLAKDGETVSVRHNGESKLRVPVHTLAGIVCLGHISASPALLGFCAERNVGVAFLTPTGRFQARVTGPVSGNVLLRRAQYRRADDPEARVAVARPVVVGKLANARTVLLRGAREYPDRPGSEALGDAARRLSRLAGRLEEAVHVDTVRGLEGEAGRIYFGVFDHLITAQKDDFRFTGRSRRPPLDAINALLSFLYTLLVQDVASALEAVGLDPAVGYLHTDRPGRPGLALDLVEELRPVIADRLALTLVNRQQVRPQGFIASESGAVMMTDETRKSVIVAYQERKQEEVQHGFLDEKLPIGLLPHAQALLLARFLRGDLDGYPPLLWR